MVVNQGLFATERGKTVIQEGLKQASTPLTVDGSIFVKTDSTGDKITDFVVPLRAFGVKYVAMWKKETVVTLKIGSKAYADIYQGVDEDYDPTSKTLDDLVTRMNTTSTAAKLFIENSNGDSTLDSFEKGYLIIHLSSSDAASVRTRIVVEIRLEKTTPLSIEFTIPETMPKSTWVLVG